MGQKKQIRKIRKNTFKMGNKMFKAYKKKGGTKQLRASVRAYDVALRAIKYQILYDKNS